MLERSSKAVAISAHNEARIFSRNVFVLATITLALLAFATQAFAQDKIIKSHGISTFGELKYDADFKHLDYVNPGAPKGGEISTWALGTFDSMHPYITKGNAAGSSSIFYESLMTGTADEPDSLYGLLAESIEYPENRQWAIFNLRPEARFSDGSPVTADDIVFTFYILLEKGIPSLKTVFADFESVEALDTHRVKFTFVEGASTRELPMTAAGLPAFSRKFYETRDFAESTLEPGLGSGPYVLDEVDVGRKLVYRYNENYWGKDLPINVGRNNFETIRYEYYADTTPAFEGFKGGTYTYRTENSSKSWATGYDFPAIRKGHVIKAELPDGNIGSAQGFIFNLRKGKFSDPRVREAIGMMFNFEWSNIALFYGLYERVDSFWENSSLEAKGMPSAAELTLLEPLREFFPAEVFDAPVYSPAKSSENELDRKMLRAAGKLLDEAGWTIQDGVRKNADGEVLSVEFLNYSQAFDRIVNPYVEALKRLGINASLTRVDIPQFLERRRAFDFDMMTTTYGNSLTPGLGLLQRWNSENAMVPSRNVAGLQNEGIDRLLEAALAAKTREDLTVATNAIDRVLRAMKVWVPQWYKDVHTVAYLNVYSYPEPLPPFDLGAFDFWWFDEAKAAKLRAEGAL